MRSLRSVAAGLAVALVVGCSGTPEASPSPESSPSPELSPPASALVTPLTSVATSPIETPSTSPSPIASPQPPTNTPSAPPTEQPPSPSAAAGPRWVPLAETAIGLPAFDPDYDLWNVIGFDAGYVYTVNGGFWFSVDGVRWEQVSLPSGQPGCEGEEREFVIKGATNRRSLLLLGQYTTDDCDLQTFAWLTDDGRSWRRSGPIGDVVGDTEAESYDVWPVPNGWDAALGTYDDDTAILHSSDGMSWTKTATVAAWGSLDGAADGIGKRALSVLGSRGSICPPELANRCQLKFQVRVVTSADGLTWTDLAAPLDRAQGEAFIEALEPPTTAGSPWILFVREYGDDSSFQGRTLWLSDDLKQWAAVSPPKASTFPLASTSEGLLASACNRREQKCALYLTSDGREWTAIAGGHDSAALVWVAEGPAGVIAGTVAGAVYRLVP